MEEVLTMADRYCFDEIVTFFPSWKKIESFCRKSVLMTNMQIVNFFFLMQTMSPTQDANAHTRQHFVQTYGNCFLLIPQPLRKHGEL